MIFVLISVAALVLIILGVRVIQGKLPATDRRADLKRIADWEAARKAGPVWHALRSVGPFVAGYCILAPMTRFWREHGRLGYPLEQLGEYLTVALIATAVAGFFSWKILDAGAREATERLARSE